MNAAVAEVLPPIQSAVAEFNATAAGLAELREKYEGIQFDCSTTVGDKDARQARLALVTLRTTLEARRKELKEPLLAQGKLIDDEAKRLTAEFKSLEDPIDAQIKAAEAEREARRQERERQEAERLAAINASIERIVRMPFLYVSAAPNVIADAIAEVNGMDLAALFDDTHRPRAEEAKAGALEALGNLFNERTAAVAEAARLAAERAELERQQAEAKAAQKAADEAAAAARAEADRIAKVERERLAAEQAAEQERIAAAAAAEQAERERVLAEREAAVRADAERIERERAAERARMEAETIANATLRTAAEGARDYLLVTAPNELVTRTLVAALEREA